MKTVKTQHVEESVEEKKPRTRFKVKVSLFSLFSVVSLDFQSKVHVVLPSCCVQDTQRQSRTASVLLVFVVLKVGRRSGLRFSYIKLYVCDMKQRESAVKLQSLEFQKRSSMSVCFSEDLTSQLFIKSNPMLGEQKPHQSDAELWTSKSQD